MQKYSNYEYYRGLVVKCKEVKIPTRVLTRNSHTTAYAIQIMETIEALKKILKDILNNEHNRVFIFAD